MDFDGGWQRWAQIELAQLLSLDPALMTNYQPRREWYIYPAAKSTTDLYLGSRGTTQFMNVAVELKCQTMRENISKNVEKFATRVTKDITKSIGGPTADRKPARLYCIGTTQKLKDVGRDQSLVNAGAQIFYHLAVQDTKRGNLYMVWWVMDFP